MAKAKTAVLDVPCYFGNVSVGDATARVGVQIDRKELTLAQADKNLCGRRLTCRIVARLGGGQSDQDSLPGAEDDPVMDGVCDVKSISAKPKSIGAGLTFSLEEVDPATLCRFAQRNGRLTVTEIADIPEGKAIGGDQSE